MEDFTRQWATEYNFQSYVQTMLYKTCTVSFLNDFECVRPNQPSKAKTQNDLFFTNSTRSSLSGDKALKMCRGFAIFDFRWDTPEGIW